MYSDFQIIEDFSETHVSRGQVQVSDDQRQVTAHVRDKWWGCKRKPTAQTGSHWVSASWPLTLMIQVS